MSDFFAGDILEPPEVVSTWQLGYQLTHALAAEAMESGSERGMKEFYRLLGSINEDNVEQVNMRSVQEFLEIIITFDWNGLLKALLENAYI
eukprot:CAMPEP_0114693976 /NCGR_PEP_ID=MMETSP0191-20121206/69669_1 /TAXON_ID=126664 /ORGANISM="Sorites sp." /LENGTH=90 /DNA_ID=CAMNT_0001988303 /DNA_START=967 /DNA_END=1236 /DNA_ORIENTATION=+